MDDLGVPLFLETPKYKLLGALSSGPSDERSGKLLHQEMHVDGEEFGPRKAEFFKILLRSVAAINFERIQTDTLLSNPNV